MFPLPPHFLSPPAPFPRPLFGDLMAMSSNNNMDSSTASLLQSPLLQLLLLDQQQRQQQQQQREREQQLALALQQLLGPLLLKEGMEHSAAVEEPASAAAKVDEAGGADQQFWHNILTTMGAAEPLSSEQPSSSESAGRTTTASAEEMPKEAKPPTKARKRHRPTEAEESTMAVNLVGGGTRKKRRRGRVLEVETDSPVAGMFIKEACDEEELRRAAEASELDDSAAFVHVTEESRQAIAAIPDIIGPARCALCKILFDDLFRLAMHRCPRIRHQEYRCEECEKVFSCPANLASHRRWHLPKTSAAESKRRPKGGHARHDPPMPVVDENGEEAEETEDKLEKMDKTEEEKGEEAFEDGGHLLMLQMAHQGLRERLAEAATALITLGLAK